MAQASIAMVEDSDEDFAAFRRVFSRQPNIAAIERWASGEDALAALSTRDIASLEVLTVDLHLPGIDGIAVVEQIRALPGGRLPAICLLSGSTAPADRERAIEAGADEFIVKPSDLDGLRELPRRVFDVAARVAGSR